MAMVRMFEREHTPESPSLRPRPGGKGRSVSTPMPGICGGGGLAGNRDKQAQEGVRDMTTEKRESSKEGKRSVADSSSFYSQHSDVARITNVNVKDEVRQFARETGSVSSLSSPQVPNTGSNGNNVLDNERSPDDAFLQDSQPGTPQAFAITSPNKSQPPTLPPTLATFLAASRRDSTPPPLTHLDPDAAAF